MTTKEILQKMKEILKERGWTTGTLVRHEYGACCLLGAWALAEGHEPSQLQDDKFVGGDFGMFVDPDKVHTEVGKLLVDCANDRWGYTVDNPTNLFSFNDGILNYMEAKKYEVEHDVPEVILDTIDCAISKAQ